MSGKIGLGINVLEAARHRQDQCDAGTAQTRCRSALTPPVE
jgi:hypothetical protein